ncbi:MAG: citramalate synthase, partial [Thermosynechococcaceae cyanobacterium]
MGHFVDDSSFLRWIMDAHSSVVNSVCLYDTTLRDGSQQEGMALSVEDKLKIAHLLDKLGVPFIEGGWPGANPKDGQFFERLKADPLVCSEIVAFSSTRRPGVRAEAEGMFVPILAAETRWVTLFGKSWDLHVTESLKTSLDENLAMIEDSVAFLTSQGRRVIYDAEHWFDGYQANPAYALETLKVAIAAGAEWLVLCDTNGGSLPTDVARMVGAVLQDLQPTPLSKSIQLGIHAHNDGGMAAANSVLAVQQGVQMVQGTINGYGERCGNANLCTVVPNLQFKLGYPCLPPGNIAELTTVSRLVSEIVNLAPNEQAPFVGASAFAHKGGIHVSAVQRNPVTYEHIDPQRVGNRRRIVVSEQSGISNVLEKANHFGFPLAKGNPISRQVLSQLKQLESEGYQFEAADASFELLIREALNQRPSFFALKGFDIYCRGHQVERSDVLSSTVMATVKVMVNDQEMLTAAEGNGPISALDAALRKSLVNFYPIIAEFQLTDYKVRILDGKAGTSAKTRVLVESSN